jgi:hypothetical protein
MNWWAASKVDAQKFSCKVVAANGLTGDEEHEAGCSIISFSNCLYVNLPGSEGDGGSSNYNPPKKPSSKNLLEMAKGHHGSLHLPLGVQIEQATLPRNSWDGDLMLLQLGMGMEGAVKLSPANLFSDSHE